MTTCKDCYRRNPATGYCPVRTYEVEENHEPCGSYATPPRDMNELKEEATKVCKRCGKELPLSSFSRNRNGLLGVCKDCMKAAQKKCAKPAKPAKPEKPADPEAPKEEPAHPELHESEDERTRKELLHYILYEAKGIPEEQEHSWVSFLEKLKAQKPAEWSKVDINIHYYLCKLLRETWEKVDKGSCIDDAITWFEELPERVFPHSWKLEEWSDEEVHSFLKDIVRILRDRGYEINAEIVVKEKL